MRFPWRPRIRGMSDEITPWLGLSLAALYLATVAAVGVAAGRIHRHHADRMHLDGARQSVFWFARYVALIDQTDAETLSAELRRAGRHETIAYCAIVSPEGIMIAHSDPVHVGRTARDLVWIDEPELGIRMARHPQEGRTVLAARIVSPHRHLSGHDLHVGLHPPRTAWSQSELMFWAGYILLAVMSLFLLVYHLLRRTVQPLAVIRDRLLSCREPTAEKIRALRLNDSFDQISASWNHLIDFICQAQEQLRKVSLTTDVTAAMDGYRSERLTGILMQVPFGIMVVDPDETISFANRAAIGMLAAHGETLDNTPADSVLDESLRIALLSPAGSQRSARAAASRWIDHTFKRPHGDVTLRFWSAPSESGGIEHVIFVQDVTQTKEAERARDQFLYHVTHELRTPLTNIRAYAETLSQGVLDDEQTVRECYNVIMGETQRLSRLVEDILNVSQLEVGTARMTPTELQLDRLIRDVVQDQQANADAKNIDLILNLPAKMPAVRGDKERLCVVFTNLIGNAIKYTPEGGRVDVTATAEQNRIRIAVADTGFGIAPEHQERIFEKFYRVADEQVAAIPGTGLGLAIVQETLRLHGGSILLNSAPGTGSTFTVVLPATSIGDGTGESGELAIASVEEL